MFLMFLMFLGFVLTLRLRRAAVMYAVGLGARQAFVARTQSSTDDGDFLTVLCCLTEVAIAEWRAT